MSALWTVSDGKLYLDFHPGQSRAWQSDRRIVAVLAGTQSGKTSFLPWLLWREIQTCGGGDYIAATATYDLFKLKFLPALRECFEHVLGWGRYWAGDRIIELRDPITWEFKARRADDPMWARIILRSAESGSGLESSTAKAALLDEAGMESFTTDTWEAVLRRLSLNRGRVFIGTTLYHVTGWLKNQVYDRWRAGDPDVDVIQFDSTENPAFPKEEAVRARSALPPWKYDLFYRGLYSRPAGLIYDVFDEDKHKQPRVALPDAWPRYLGLDFGGINTAAVFLAAELPRTERGDPEWDDENPTGRFFLYREYHAGNKTAGEHAGDLLRGEPHTPICVGGSKSEGQWRREFHAGGLPVRAPDQGLVEVGINRVYGMFKQGKLIVFDDCAGLLEELRSYSRVLDAAGEPTEEIEDKETFHRLDALRYIGGWLMRTNKPGVR